MAIASGSAEMGDGYGLDIGKYLGTPFAGGPWMSFYGESHRALIIICIRCASI